MPQLEILTRSHANNGLRTSFWNDCWLTDKCLRLQYPALFSHSLFQAASVSWTLSRSIGSTLAPRLFTRAVPAYTGFARCFPLGGRGPQIIAAFTTR
ncbi:hypothetical protein DAI22_01g157450 [Oryza sativa Japonica Group]|nr:hypothetical protein DAI22_01g157450 [Oryza sativa Japonica Group]